MAQKGILISVNLKSFYIFVDGKKVTNRWERGFQVTPQNVKNKI
jgi:hypothetical protein